MSSFHPHLRRLVLGLALAAPLFAAAPAGAATCGYDAAGQTVSIALSAEDAALGRSGDELVLLGGVDCGDATIANTTKVAVTGTPADEVFRVSYLTGPLPGIDVVVDLGADVVQDALLIQMTPGRDYVTAGAGAVNVTPRDLDPDVFFVDEHLLIESDDGDDVLSGQGGAGTGAPLATSAGWTAGPGNDKVTGGNADDLVVPGLGDDALDGAAGTNGVSYLDAPAGVFVDFNGGTVTGGSGTDTIANFQSANGSQFADQLVGAAGNDGLAGYGGDDHINGRWGDDELVGGPGNDTMQGGVGFDRVVYTSAPAGVNVDLAVGVASGGAGSDAFNGAEEVIGSPFADQLVGTSGPNRLYGLGGPDMLTGRGGDDALLGGDDVDGVSYVNAPAGVVVDLTAGTATGGDGNDGLSGVENVFGSVFNDRLYGDAQRNLLSGLAGIDRLAGFAGDDTLVGWAGADSIVGGDGADLLTPGAGNDQLLGGPGRDRVLYGGAPNAVHVSLLTGVAFTGADGKDTLNSVEDVLGSPFADHIIGNGVPNALDGAGGHDWLFGRAGADALLGGLGNDRLDGGLGFDACAQQAGFNPIGWPKNCP